MSIAIVVYFGVAGLLVPVCTIGVRRAAGPGRADKLAAGLLAAIVWPFTLPVLAIVATRRRVEEPPAAVGGLLVLPVDAPRRPLVAVAG